MASIELNIAMEESVQAVKALIGAANPTVANTETVFNFMKLIADVYTGTGTIASGADKTVWQKALHERYNVDTVEWAIISMNRYGVFGEVLRKAFNFPAEKFDHLTSMEDIALDDIAANIINQNAECIALIDMSPTFKEAMQTSAAYLDGITGTDTGIQFLIDNFSLYEHVVTSAAWQASFMRTTAKSCEILDDVNWRNKFFTIDAAALVALFTTTGWYAKAQSSDAVWTKIIQTNNSQMYQLFLGTDAKRIDFLNTASTSRMNTVMTSPLCCNTLFSNSSSVAAALVASPHNKICISNRDAMIAMLVYPVYYTAMCENVACMDALMGTGVGQQTFSRNAAAMKKFATTPLCVQRSARVNHSPVADALIASYSADILKIIQSTTYFTRSASTRQESPRGIGASSHSGVSATHEVSSGYFLIYQARNDDTAYDTRIASIEVDDDRSNYSLVDFISSASNGASTTLSILGKRTMTLMADRYHASIYYWSVVYYSYTPKA